MQLGRIPELVLEQCAEYQRQRSIDAAAPECVQDQLFIVIRRAVARRTCQHVLDEQMGAVR